MGRVAVLVIALATAPMAAMIIGIIAHNDLGFPLDMIRVDALSGAGLVFAAIACAALLRPKR
jgi:hypothetical protein